MPIQTATARRNGCGGTHGPAIRRDVPGSGGLQLISSNGRSQPRSRTYILRAHVPSRSFVNHRTPEETARPRLPFPSRDRGTRRSSLCPRDWIAARSRRVTPLVADLHYTDTFRIRHWAQCLSRMGDRDGKRCPQRVDPERGGGKDGDGGRRADEESPLATWRVAETALGCFDQYRVWIETRRLTIAML